MPTKPHVSGARLAAVKVLLGVEAACAAFGYLGGIMFFIDPSGKAFGLDPLLAALPVDNFLLVGVWLFVVYGVGFSLVTYALRARLWWSWLAAVLLSVVWLVWIGIETAIWGVDPFIDVWLIPPLLGLVLLAKPGLRHRLASRGPAAV